MRNEKVQKIVLTGLFAPYPMLYLLLQIKITCRAAMLLPSILACRGVLGALLLGGLYGGLAVLSV